MPPPFGFASKKQGIKAYLCTFPACGKVPKDALGAVNSHRLCLYQQHRCAFDSYTLPVLRGDAGAECPPDHMAVSSPCVSGDSPLIKGVPAKRVGDVASLLCPGSDSTARAGPAGRFWKLLRAENLYAAHRAARSSGAAHVRACTTGSV